MSGASVETELPQGTIAKYNVTDAAIADLRSRFSGLTILGVKDKEGYKLVHDGRIVVRDLLINVEKTRKELKQESLEYGRKVDAEAKSISDRLEPLRDALSAEEKRIDKELEAIAAKEQQAVSDKVNARIKAFTDVNGLAYVRVELLAAMQDDDYEAILAVATEAFNKAEAIRIEKDAELERLRKADEEAKAKAAAALEDQRKAQEEKQIELDRQRVENDKKEAALKAEADHLEKQKQAAATAELHAEEIAKARREAAEDVKLEVIRKTREKELEAEAAQRKAASEKAEAEAAMSDKQKLAAYAAALVAVEIPEVKGRKAITDLGNFILELRKGLRTLK